MFLAIFIFSLVNVALADLADDDVLYYLYNKETGASNPKLIYLGRVEETDFDASRPLKVLCHGYLDGIDASWYASAVSEYLQSQNVNIIAIDWPATDLYSNSIATAKHVAVLNARLLQELVNKRGVNLDNVHLIGHSLGAHIFGLTGKCQAFKKGRQSLNCFFL